MVWSGLGLGLEQFGTIEPKCWDGTGRDGTDGTGWTDWISLTSLTTRSPYGDNNCCSFQKKVGHSQS